MGVWECGSVWECVGVSVDVCTCRGCAYVCVCVLGLWAPGVLDVPNIQVQKIHKISLCFVAIDGAMKKWKHHLSSSEIRVCMKCHERWCQQSLGETTVG